MALEESGNEWRDWRVYTVKELERLNTSMDAIKNQIAYNNSGLTKDIEAVSRELRRELGDFKEEEFSKIKIKLAMLEVRAGMWGAIVGAGTSIVVSAFMAAVFLKFIHP